MGKMLLSLPVRGAWIEIGGYKHLRRFSRSLPVRGAWIEITNSIFTIAPERSLPVRGAWIEMVPNFDRLWSTIVAPRAGSVD